MALFEDKQAALSGELTSNFLSEAMVESEKFREEYAKLPNVIKAEDMPWERSPDGLIKHLVNKKMQTRECCMEAYMQFLNNGERSGKHRHMWEELIFVVEGSGLLHCDLMPGLAPGGVRVGLGRGALYVLVVVGRLRLHRALHIASAFRQSRRGVPHHRDVEPYRQRHGL